MPVGTKVALKRSYSQPWLHCVMSLDHLKNKGTSPIALPQTWHLAIIRLVHHTACFAVAEFINDTKQLTSHIALNHHYQIGRGCYPRSVLFHGGFSKTCKISRKIHEVSKIH